MSARASRMAIYWKASPPPPRRDGRRPRSNRVLQSARRLTLTTRPLRCLAPRSMLLTKNPVISRESAMSKMLIATTAVAAIVAFNLTPGLAQARSCARVMVEAHGATQGLPPAKLTGDSTDTLPAMLVGHAWDMPRPAVRVGGRKACAQPVRARPSFAAS